MITAVIVTGHAGGIGRSIARELIDCSFDVIGVDKVTARGFEGQQITTDLLDVVRSKAAFDQLQLSLEAMLDGRGVSALINNAAIQPLGPDIIDDLSSYEEAFSVNAIAPLALTCMLKEQLESAGGAVINIGSIHTTLTKRGFGPYSVSKAALSGVNRVLAIEYGRHLRSIEIRPAAVATSMLEAGFEGKAELRASLDLRHPTGRISQAEDLAVLCRLLVENKLPFLNGSVIGFDGGIASVLSDPDNDRF